MADGEVFHNLYLPKSYAEQTGDIRAAISYAAGEPGVDAGAWACGERVTGGSSSGPRATTRA